MSKVKYIGIRFKSVGKIYYFSPNGLNVKNGDKVIVETIRGVECGDVVLVDKEIEESELANPLKPIIRVATKRDLETIERNKKKEKEAFKICEEKIEKHSLAMDLVDVECTFDNTKLLFYFTAENRVDFRELVKDLASVFHTRIELRQIGVRDEAKMLGGIGICGQPFCCARFLGEFQPVSVKMAKEQSLSLNPTKLSGSCGRLMCCLKYESEGYEQLFRETPKIGSYVKTAEGNGVITDSNLLTGTLKIKLDKTDNVINLNKADVSVLNHKAGSDDSQKLNTDEQKELDKLEKEELSDRKDSKNDSGSRNSKVSNQSKSKYSDKKNPPKQAKQGFRKNKKS